MSASILYYLNMGLSPTQALDRFMVEDEGLPPEAFADARGVTARAVTKNLADADELLPTEDTDDDQEDLL